MGHYGTNSENMGQNGTIFQNFENMGQYGNMGHCGRSVYNRFKNKGTTYNLNILNGKQPSKGFVHHCFILF